MLPFARSIAPGRPPVTSRWRILDWELQLSQMRLLEMAVVPIQDALEHVDVVRHLPRRVALARIENHLSFDSEMLERAIEPLGLAHGIVRVVQAIEDQRGRAGIADEGRRRIAGERIAVLPRIAQIPFVAGRETFRLEFGLLVEDACARDGRLEAVRLRDREGRPLRNSR